MVAHPEPAQTRLMAQRGGQEALPGAAFAGDDEVLVVTAPAAVGQPQQLVLVEVAAQREVHLLDGGRVAKAGRFQQPLMAVLVRGEHADITEPAAERRPAALQDRPAPSPARQPRLSPCAALQTLQQRGRPQPRRRAPAGMIRTLGCLLAFIRLPLRCSTVPHQRRARNGTTTAQTPPHLSCNQPRPGARNATPAR